MYKWGEGISTCQKEACLGRLNRQLKIVHGGGERPQMEKAAGWLEPLGEMGSSHRGLGFRDALVQVQGPCPPITDHRSCGGAASVAARRWGTHDSYRGKWCGSAWGGLRYSGWTNRCRTLPPSETLCNTKHTPRTMEKSHHIPRDRSITIR